MTQKDERSDKIAGLELGADDYVTKPFDIEELKLRVRTAIRSFQRLNMTDPRTGLPSGRLIEDQLRTLMRTSGWTFILLGVDHFNSFSDVYGFVAADEVMRFTALLMNEIVDDVGTLDDFVGHAGGETFIIITMTKDVPRMVDTLRTRFNEGVLSHHSFIDREQGFVELPDGSKAPLMGVSLGVISDQQQNFTDIREITETAAELRRLDQAIHALQ